MPKCPVTYEFHVNSNFDKFCLHFARVENIDMSVHISVSKNNRKCLNLGNFVLNYIKKKREASSSIFSFTYCFANFIYCMSTSSRHDQNQNCYW